MFWGISVLIELDMPSDGVRIHLGERIPDGRFIDPSSAFDRVEHYAGRIVGESRTRFNRKFRLPLSHILASGLLCRIASCSMPPRRPRPRARQDSFPIGENTDLYSADPSLINPRLKVADRQVDLSERGETASPVLCCGRRAFPLSISYFRLISAKPVYGTSASGMRTDPSARWQFSSTAMMPRLQAMAVPLSMWTNLFLPSSSL